MRGSLFPPRRRTLTIALAILSLGLLFADLPLRTAPPRGFAAAATPPAPPTFVPTPIGAPPGPPTGTPAPSAPATATAITTPTGTTTATVAGTAFSLDAARVSRVNNPGNLSGLSAVKRGSKVWLMMYFTVSHLAKAVTRVTTYTIQYRGRVIFKVAYRGKMSRSEVGRFSRYTVFSVSRSLPYGSYVYKATLAVGKVSRTKRWTFAVAQRNRTATR